MGIYADVHPFLSLFLHTEQRLILSVAYNLSVQRHNSTNIFQAVERVSKIVSALKHYAHYQDAVDMTEAHLADNIDIVLTLYHNQLKHDIDVVRRYDEVPAIRCYPDELTQVWTNVIHNAIQAMDGKGVLEITLSQREQGVVAAFTDSGCGVPEAIKERIFEPFVTTKVAGEGSGLGLDICRQIIEKHQGTIDFESQPGKTTFSVWLPLSKIDTANSEIAHG
jgi:signal transduction histidine kinase